MTDIEEGIEILLVEDNPTDAELTIRALRKKNLANHLMWVKDGAAALDFIFGTGEFSGRDTENRPRLILLDLQLPKVHGLDVLRQIKADERTRTIPVVVLTSSKQDRDLTESYETGVNSYISKPVQFEDFINTVAELGMYWLLINRPVRDENL